MSRCEVRGARCEVRGARCEERKTGGEFHAYGIYLGVVDALPRMGGVVGVHNPVYHILTVIVEHAGGGGGNGCGEFYAALKTTQLFGFQVLVGFMSANAVVQLRERRHA